MAQVETQGAPKDEQLALIGIPYYPFPLSEVEFTRVKNGDKRRVERKVTLATGEFQDLKLDMLLRPPGEMHVSGPRKMRFELNANENYLRTKKFLHQVRTSSSLGQTSQYVLHNAFFPEYLAHFNKLGIQVNVPESQDFEGGVFDGVIDPDKLSIGEFVVRDFFNRTKDALQPEPLVFPVSDRDTLLQFGVTFTYARSVMPGVFLNQTYNFE